MKPAKAEANNQDVSFALKEQETCIVLEGVINRAKESVFTHIKQSTDIVLVTSTNRDGKSAFLAELSKEIDSEIRSLSLHSDDLLGASSKEGSPGEVDFSLISAIIYESIQLDEYLLISIDDADKLPIDNFNELVTLALSTNTKKNNIIFLFAGGPDLLGQVEQISNIKRLSIAHCTLDELVYEDLVEFIDLRQTSTPSDLQFNFDDQALRTIVTHSSGSLFKAAVLLEWCREYSNFIKSRDINAGIVSKLLSILLNKSQVDGVNLFASYPTPGFDFSSSIGDVDDTKSATPKRVRKSKPKSQPASKQAQHVEIKVVGKKSAQDKPNVYERIMADASEEELISEQTENVHPQQSTSDNIPEDELDSDPTMSIDASELEAKFERLVLKEQSSVEEIESVELTVEPSDANKQEENITEHEPKHIEEESKPLYIENTDLSLTRLVPRQGTQTNHLSSLQWTFIILTIGAILFYAGIMFIASNGNPQSIPMTDTSDQQEMSIVAEESAINEDVSKMNIVAEEHANSEDVAIIDTIDSSVMEADESVQVSLTTDTDDTDSPTLTEQIKAFFSSFSDSEAETKINIEYENEIANEEVVFVEQNTVSAGNQKENTIQALLNLAQIQMENKKLTSPPSDNALDTYRMVLQLDPNNSTAASGIESIRVRYLIWAEQQAVAGDSEKAKYYLERAKEMSD